MSEKYQGLSVYVKKGHEIPDAYLKAIDKYDHNRFGLVQIKKDGSCLDIGYVNHKTTTEGLREWMRKSNMVDRVIYLGLHPDKDGDEERQPFLVLKKDAKPFLACTIVGDFKQHIPAGDTVHSAAFFTANTKLQPYLDQVWRMCRDNPKQFWDELRSASSDKMIVDMIGLQGGQISFFVANNGDDVGIKMFAKSMPTMKEYPWGVVSDTLGYVYEEPKPEPTATTAKTNKKKFAVTVEDDDSKADDNPPWEEPKKEGEEPKVPPLSTLKDQPYKVIYSDGGQLFEMEVEPGKKTLMYVAPAGKRKYAKKLYKSACGRDLQNKDIEARIAVVVKNESMIRHYQTESKRLRELESTAAKVQTPATGSDAERLQTPKDQREVAQGKNTVTGQTVVQYLSKSEEEATYNRPATSVHEDRPPGASPIYSVITPKDKAGFKEITKALDKNGQVVSDPTVAQEMENSQNFAEEIGYPGLAETMGWRDDFLWEMLRNAPRILIRWTLALRRRIDDLEKELARYQFDPAIKRDDDIEGEQEIVASFSRKRKRA